MSGRGGFTWPPRAPTLAIPSWACPRSSASAEFHDRVIAFTDNGVVHDGLPENLFRIARDVDPAEGHLRPRGYFADPCGRVACPGKVDGDDREADEVGIEVRHVAEDLLLVGEGEASRGLRKRPSLKRSGSKWSRVRCPARRRHAESIWIPMLS